MLETTAPILPSKDFDETSAFYGRIGFRETWRWEGHGYMIMVMDSVELHFFGYPGLDVTQNYCGAYIRTSRVDELSEKVMALELPKEGIPRAIPAEDKDWEMRELAIVDPNGTLLRIGQYM